MMNPAVMSVFGFDPIPIRAKDLDEYFALRRHRFQRCGAVKWRCLQLSALIFDSQLDLMSQVVNLLLQLRNAH